MNTAHPGGFSPEHQLATHGQPAEDQLRDPIFGIPDVPTVTPEEVQAAADARVRAFYERMPVFGDTFTTHINEGQLPPDLRDDFSDTWYGR